MNDDSTTVAELRRVMADFVRERDWNQFHSPKNLAMSMAIETAELMEHFQWIDCETSRPSQLDPGQLHAIGEEIADVVCYALSLVNELGLDLATIFRAKMESNRLKYPAGQFQGRFKAAVPSGLTE